MRVVYVCKILLKILNIKSKFFMYESVLTLISKRHKDSSIHIRECPELGCNLLDVVLMFILKCHTNSSI